MRRTLVHSSSMSDVFYRADTRDIEKHRGSRPGSEVILDREAGVLAKLDGKVGPSLISYDDIQKILIMTRVGSHDLSDVIHDLPRRFIPTLVTKFMQDVQMIHDLGHVHRDIKPGNIMVNMDHIGVTSYAGIVDFGMTLRSNKKQNENLALGGTVPYSHPTQMENDFKQMRCHPGQDWFAVARTIAHLLVGGSSPTFESGLTKDNARELIESVVTQAESIFGTDKVAFLKLLSSSLKPESSKEEALPEFFKLGPDALKELLNANFPNYSYSNPENIAFQQGSSGRPKRHDVVLIVDATGSMKSKIDHLKNTFEEIAELVKGRIDLRLDLWSLGDYSDFGIGSSVKFLGQRMRSETFQQSLEYLEADRGQGDEAEAYEMALQYAYLRTPRNFWVPRKETQRTIIVVGDSYAHGWLKKYSPWGAVRVAAEGKVIDKNTEPWTRAPPDMIMKKKYDNFVRRHGIYMTKNRLWREKEEYEKAFQNIIGRDNRRPGEGGHVEIPGEAVANRANWKRAITQCTEQKNATIHTVGVGSNLVSASFLKYVAMFGNGTFTELGDDEGELALILKAIFTSVDPKIFRDLEKDTIATNPNTQALSSITTFVIDSLTD